MTQPDILRSSTKIPEHKVISYEEAREILAMCREENIFAVLAIGVFDGIDPIDLAYLLSARDAGQKLLVGVESDSQRPQFSVDARLRLLSALEAVTYVFSFTDDVIYGDLAPGAIAVAAWDPHMTEKTKKAHAAGIDLIVVSGQTVHS